MKAPPTNPYQLRQRALAAFLEDISDRNSRSFERTDALRFTCAALAGSEPERRLSGDQRPYACASHASGSRSSDGSGALRHVVKQRNETGVER